MLMQFCVNTLAMICQCALFSLNFHCTTLTLFVLYSKFSPFLSSSLLNQI
uniref:Uncharacterized protein n=1 Tax=Rhizophora mucronata TaxID=61149 RepID=A0A2P2IHM4_RHIMU